MTRKMITVPMISLELTEAGKKFIGGLACSRAKNFGNCRGWEFQITTYYLDVISYWSRDLIETKIGLLEISLSQKDIQKIIGCLGQLPINGLALNLGTLGKVRLEIIRDIKMMTTDNLRVPILKCPDKINMSECFIA